MDENLKKALQRWKALECNRDADPVAFDLVSLEVDQLLHGDPKRGRGVLWYLDVDRNGSALRRYSSSGYEDTNMRVVPRFVFGEWAKEMARQNKPFMRGYFPVFSLFVTPDDKRNLGGIELRPIGEHNFYAHTGTNRSLDPHCNSEECLGYGYSPFDPVVRENLRVMLKTLAKQEVLYPQAIGIGRDTHLIIGNNGQRTQVLVMRRINSWETEPVANLEASPSPPREGRVRRGMRALSETETRLVGEIGTLVYNPLWATDDPSLLWNTARWRKSRTAIFTPNGGEPQTLTIINNESVKLPAH